MFIGHLAVGFASKRLAPRASLGTLMAAPLLLDLIWPAFVLAGFERFRIDPGNTAVTPLAFDSYPWSHSLVMSIVWALLFAGGYYAITRYTVGAEVIAAGVVSHWVLDVVSHRPDMPLFPWASSPRIGFGLWESVPATLAVETSMFVAGVALYVHTTRARDRVGRWALAAFVGFLLIVYAVNLFGPLPSSVRAIAVAALAAWIFPVWAWWVDAHRDMTLVDASR
ncbi:MAG: metal-dependent hydrolase [Polyangiaceae bacterium]